MATGNCTYFAPPTSLNDPSLLLNAIKTVRPTIFFGVPRVWERIESALRSVEAEATGIHARLLRWARNVGLKTAVSVLQPTGSGHQLQGDGTQRPSVWAYKIAQMLVFNKVRGQLGLDHARLLFSGAAPLDHGSLNYFLSFGMVIGEIYGMSETSGPHLVTLPRRHSFFFGSVGLPMPGLTTFTVPADLSGNSIEEIGESVGELCHRGRSIMMGYYKDEKATLSVIDEDGTLHSGDLGLVSTNGAVYVTGRAKEVIVSAGGENISPVAIEAVVKDELKLTAHCVVVGDRRPFLSLLITLPLAPIGSSHPSASSTLASANQPHSFPSPLPPSHSPHSTSAQPRSLTGGLTSTPRYVAPVVRQLLEAEGSTAVTPSEACNDHLIHRAITDALTRVNKRVVSRASQIRRFIVLPFEFTPEGGELTHTLKVKRSSITNKYHNLVEALYRDDPGEVVTDTRDGISCHCTVVDVQRRAKM
eukprot:GHVN01003467.1.p1 GENE.GHVN01003467.1~~GHVN01003467.1.p1  ORF type:complete len:495 (-),score=121.14 GHVN01003467.1:268-1689(-)